ncbi:MAG TPA: DUF1015 domain-containing protein [Deltaproteobacteria bacterium]|nr:DUF1015 domain-containing protein [Deltaproteobacteria bacterium]
MNYENIALHVPEILLPGKGTDLTRWAVVACDQYTSQPKYWERVRDLVNGSPSTLSLIVPEAYLEEIDHEKTAHAIRTRMETYLSDGTLCPMKPGFILVDRQTSRTPSRKGLIVALDLEKYDFSEGSTSLIRATEGTVIDRLPPRVKIRAHAPLELPHIMVLIDDPDKTVIEPLFHKTLEKVYDFELMMGGGHIKGYMIDKKEIMDEIAINLAKLADPETFSKKYRVTGKDVLLYAMGDGNHSLATAKSVWEQIKNSAEDKDSVMEHPARHSLVELVNVHDAGLVFEPIHRVVFNVPVLDLLEKMNAFLKKQGQSFSYSQCSLQELNLFPGKGSGIHKIPFVSEKVCGTIHIDNPSLNLEAGTLQTFLDAFIRISPGAKIDYIHGDDIVTALGTKPGNMGFFLPAISKHDLFRTILLDGALPRKTFSMGNADEKRFYLECRKMSH